MRLPLFPLHVVLFPGMALPLHIFEPRYREMINLCIQTGQPFGVVLIRAGAEVGQPAEPHRVGTYAHISRVERLPDGQLNIETVGEDRFHILTLHHDESYLTGTVERFPLAGAATPTAEAAARALLPLMKRYLNLLGEATAEPFDLRQLPTDPLALAYLAAIVTQVSTTEKQALLATATVTDLLNHERALYRREISLLREMLFNRQAQNQAPFLPN